MTTQLAPQDTPYIANPTTPVRAYTTTAHIDLSRLSKNAQLIRTLAAPAEVMAVVKANAYGHGALPIVRALQKEGFTYFMVATLAEAMFLRKCGIESPILVAMPPLGANLPIYTQERFLVSASSDEVCKDILAYATTGNTLQVHVKLDTGMNRLGLSHESAYSFIQKLTKYPSITLQGVWTHLATAGHTDTAFAKQQISLARSVVDQIHPFDGFFHVGNSSSLIHPNRYLRPTKNNMYRIGGALLGISAMPERAREVGLLPIMTLKSHVLAVKSVTAGETVSYGRKWTAAQDTRIAIVGAGYADGYPGSTLNMNTDVNIHVSIHGRNYPVVGSICMDMFMVDIGPVPAESPVCSGDDVILFGQGGPDINAVARYARRKAYEISCSISQRVVRTYI